MLGCDGAGHALVESVSDRPGSILVVEDDDAHVEQLRNEKIEAELGNPDDEATLESLGVDPDVVIVAGETPGKNIAIARAAEAVFPDAYRVAFTGEDATRADIDRIDSMVDSLFDPGAAVVDHLSDVVAAGKVERLRRLRSTLADVDGTLGILTHDNPDPDAIAAAIALSEIATWHGVDARPMYYGRISHQENRAFVNLLDIDLRNLDADEQPDVDHVALVDHSQPGVNDQLDSDTDVTIVIDHHPPRGPVSADFVDIREDVGATSTLLVDYLRGYRIDVDLNVATALLYGIRIDTKDFTREITTADFDAAAMLLQYADVDILQRIESPSISAETLKTIGRAIRNRNQRGGVVTSCVGQLSDRDALAQSADRLLGMDGIVISLVYGHRDGTIYLSARARGVDVDLGELLREAFDEMGSAGGHADMAGAQVTLGLFEDVESADGLTDMVEDVVTERFYSVIDPASLGDE